MLVDIQKPQPAWKKRTYPIPMPSRSAVRWKASLLRTLNRWNPAAISSHPTTIMVPALHNLMPAETVALGWLNEIDTLVTMRQRINSAARLTGWDVFTFHTQHNADRFFDSTIYTVRETWVKEGYLSTVAIREAKRRFGKPYDYFRVDARLVENLVFQSSLLDWINRQNPKAQLRFHVVGTALLPALVSARSITFNDAVSSAMKIGTRWDATLRGKSSGKTEEEISKSLFTQVESLIEGRSSLSIGVSREELPKPEAPSRSFWYSPTITAEPVLISTAHDAVNALGTLNLNSWSYAMPNAIRNVEEPIRGWLVSPLHPMARVCRWSVSNFLLGTPHSVKLFLDHIATIGRKPKSKPEPADSLRIASDCRG
jgi:hypothetical protein